MSTNSVINLDLASAKKTDNQNIFRGEKCLLDHCVRPREDKKREACILQDGEPMKDRLSYALRTTKGGNLQLYVQKIAIYWLHTAQCRPSGMIIVCNVVNTCTSGCRLPISVFNVTWVL